MPGPFNLVFGCRQASCCRPEFELYVVLPLESHLGKYGRKKYDPLRGAWPFDFKCADCDTKSQYDEKDIEAVHVVGPGVSPYFDQAYLEGRGLWCVDINCGPYSDSEPKTIYTIARAALDWEHFIEQERGTLVSKCWHPYDFLFPKTR
jgi:hypothetical protein